MVIGYSLLFLRWPIRPNAVPILKCTRTLEIQYTVIGFAKNDRKCQVKKEKHLVFGSYHTNFASSEKCGSLGKTRRLRTGNRQGMTLKWYWPFVASIYEYFIAMLFKIYITITTWKFCTPDIPCSFSDTYFFAGLVCTWILHWTLRPAHVGTIHNDKIQEMFLSLCACTRVCFAFKYRNGSFNVFFEEVVFFGKITVLYVFYI